MKIRKHIDLKDHLLSGLINLGPVSEIARLRYIKDINTILERENAQWRCFGYKDKDGNQIVFGSRYNFQIMKKFEDGKYYPDYFLLKTTAFSPDEIVYIEDLMKRDYKRSSSLRGFAFNTVYIKKMACGHFELFQHPTESVEKMLGWHEVVSEDKDRKCTRCMCNWPQVKEEEK